MPVSALTLFLALVAISLFSWLLYRPYRLRYIPGPFLASITDLWRAHLFRTGTLAPTLRIVHERYGPVVRTGPNHVSVADPSAVGIVYGTKSVWVKGPSYRTLMGVRDGREVATIISTLSEAKHTAIRRGIGAAFATNALLDYEHYLDESAEELVTEFRRMRHFDMCAWFQFYTMDVLCRVAFSESLGFVTSGHDVGNIIRALEGRFDYYNRWIAIPDIEKLLLKNPIMIRLGGGSSPLGRAAASKLDSRLTTKQPPTQRDLLQKYIEAGEKYPSTIDKEAILGFVMSTIAAGADTTAVTLTAIFYYLIKYPKAMDTLMDEIRKALETGTLSDPPRYVEANKLKYLDLVIKETLRCYPIITVPFDRIVPEGGCMIDGFYIPEGTVVACHASTIHSNKELYGDDADEWRPERWIEADEIKRRQMERAWLGFGAGKRICIGRHIAELEMKKLVPHLLLTFKVSLDDPNAKLEQRINSLAYPEPIYVMFEPKD